MWQGAGLPVCWVIFLNPADMDQRANAGRKAGAAAILVKTGNADRLAKPNRFLYLFWQIDQQGR